MFPRLNESLLGSMLAEAFASSIVENLHKDNPEVMNQFFRSLSKYRYSMQGCKNEFITETSVADALRKNKSDKVLKIWMKGPKIAFFSVANTLVDTEFNWNGKTSRAARDNSKVFGDKEIIDEAFRGTPWDKLGLTKVYMIAFSSLKALGEKKQPTEVVNPKTEKIIDKSNKPKKQTKTNTLFIDTLDTENSCKVYSYSNMQVDYHKFDKVKSVIGYTKTGKHLMIKPNSADIWQESNDWWYMNGVSITSEFNDKNLSDFWIIYKVIKSNSRYRLWVLVGRMGELFNTKKEVQDYIKSHPYEIGTGAKTCQVKDLWNVISSLRTKYVNSLGNAEMKWV